MRFIQRLGTPCCPIPSKEHFTTLQILTEMLGDYSIDQKFFHSNNGLNWIEGQDSNEQTKAIVLANDEYLFQMNITANNIYSSPADPISNDLDIGEYLSLLKNYSNIEYYYPKETLSLVGQEVHTQAITIEGDIQIFTDQQCTEYATGAEQTVYVRLNTAVGFGESFTVGDGSVKGDYFSIKTPGEGHENDPYYVRVWNLWGSDDFTEAFTEGQVVKCVKSNPDFDPVENPTTIFNKPEPPTPVGPTAIDMGLPSGTKWASCDIDLTKPGGFCETPFIYEKSFFSWGNIDGHNPSSVSAFDYNWGGVNQAEPWYEGQPYGSTPGNTLTGNIAVGEDFDAARANLGAPWRMPTNAEFAELFANIKYINADGTEVDTTKTDKRVNVNGVMGLYLESSINGARLFFSCSGNGYGRTWGNRGSVGSYWSSTWNSARNARFLNFNSGGVNPQSNGYNRYYGFALRPVQ